MEKVELLYTRLKENTPFAFLKLNDGEIKGLDPVSTGISRGAERSSALMAQKIKEALNFRKKNYYIGLPCKHCQGTYYAEAINNISLPGELAMSNILSANILINSNLDKTINALKECMGEKNIVIVTNVKNSANITELEPLNIKPYKIIEVAEKYAFETDYERIKDEWKTLQDGDIVICLCGPLGRVLCYEWYKANPQLTCLELGSMFDPLLQRRSYIYHTGNHQYCEECYPSQEATESSLLALCAGKTLNKECYYFYSWEDNANFYQYNYEKIKRNAEIRLEKEPGNTDLEKIIQKCEQKINCVTLKLLCEESALQWSKLTHLQYEEVHLYKDSSPPRVNPRPFYIVYHIATVSEKWKLLTQRSYDKLVSSGILEDENLKGIKISYLGESHLLEELKEIWHHPKVEIAYTNTDVKLYEFPAMKIIYDLCCQEDCNIMYFHCKGLLHKDDLIMDWIDLLEYFTIEKYKYCCDRLLDHSVVGCCYYPSKDQPCYVKNPYNFVFNDPHFSGNFWWTTSTHVKQLQPLSIDTRERYEAEFWICGRYNSIKENFWSFYCPGINFTDARSPLLKNKYHHFEQLDFNFVRKIKFQKKIDYRNNNKTQLFQLAKQFYNNRNLGELDKVCDLYVDYFGHMDSAQLHKILFYSLFANFDINRAKAIQRGELLYDKKDVDKDTHFYTMCNLSNMYIRDQRPIPKIIHLLFFGETKFENYHYECICSTIKHMPDYEIIIHNKKEPKDNFYWDKIKKKVTIEKIDVPEYFDGYKLNHFQYKADVVRLEILYEKGGIYLDIDMLIIKNFEHIISTGKDLYLSEEGEKGGGWINAFIAAKPKNEFLKLCLENFKTGFRMENWAWHMRDGNRLLVEQHPHYNLKYNIEILESKYFFPFSWLEREKFIHIEDNLNEEIYGIHLFETILHDVLWNNKYFNKSKENNIPRVKNLELVVTEVEDTYRPYDEILVLTLEEFPDRQKHMKKLLNENILEGTLLIHKLHDEPLLGCLQSHMNAIKYAKKHQLKSVMVFEDDIHINECFKETKIYPENWDMLYFGGILTHHTERKDGWVKGVIWCNHAYIVKDTLYDKILETYEGLDKEDMVKKGQGTDWLYTTFINPHYNCWLYEKQAIIQKDGFSLLNHKQKWGNNFDWSTWSMRNLEEHNQIVPIVAITVSTNFSDLLEHCLINQRFFKKWYIITDKKDQLTIDLIEKNNKNNKITILYHDFQNNGRTFDKGGAIRNGQEIAHNKYPDDLILLLDSDIILPSNFMKEVLNTEWKENTLYGCEDRWNYLTYNDYKNNKVTSKMSIRGKTNSNWLITGYIHMYLSKTFLYNASYNCGECDLEFHHKWEHSEKINMIVSHLGIDSDWPAGQNHWDGRKQINKTEKNLVIVDKYHNGEPAKFFIYENCCISRDLQQNKIWEKHMHNVFEKFINKDSIVLEGGCHIGSHTIKLGMLSKNVYAFEPMAKSYDLLKKNIEINNLKNVTIFEKGLSNTTDTVQFEWIPNGNPGGSGLSQNPMGKPSWCQPVKDKVVVDLTTIDLLNLTKLDFIKLDVEGYEELAIAGGIKTIQKCKPIITLEVWCNHFGGVDMNYTKNKFKNLLDMGYNISNISGPDFLFVPS